MVFSRSLAPLLNVTRQNCRRPLTFSAVVGIMLLVPLARSSFAQNADKDEPISDTEAAALTGRDRELWDALAAEQRSPHPKRVITLALEALAVDRKLVRATNDQKSKRALEVKIAELLYILGRAEVAGGRDDEALEHLQESSPRLRALFPDGYEPHAHCLNELGVLHLKRGEFQKGFDELTEAAAIFQKLAEKENNDELFLSLAIVRNNLGVLALRIGDAQTALLEMRRAEKIYDSVAQAVGRRSAPNIIKILEPKRAINLDNLGYIELILGLKAARGEHIDAAGKSFAKLYPPDRFPNGHPDLAAYLNRQGLLEMSSGHFDAARDAMSRALEMFKNFVAETHPVIGSCRRNLALLAAWQGDYPKSEALIREAISVFEKNCPPETSPQGNADLAASYHFLGEVQRLRGGSHEESRRNLYRALEMTKGLAELVGWAFDEPVGLNYAAKMVHDPLDSLLNLDAGQEDAGEHDYLAVWKSKGLVTRILQDRKVLTGGILNAVNPELMTRYFDLRRQLSYLQIATAGNPSDPRVARIKLLGNEKQDLVLGNPALSKWEEMRIKNVETTQRLSEQMPAGAVFIDVIAYMKLFPPANPAPVSRGKLHYTAFIVAPKRPVVRTELGEGEPINKAIKDWRELIEAKKPDAAPDALREVWKKLEVHFPSDTTTVIIAPDRNMAGLPWPTLPCAKGNTRLIETYTFAMAPHGPALLEWLDAKPVASTSYARFLFVGGVEYGKAAESPMAVLAVEKQQALPDRASLPNLPNPARMISNLSKLVAKKGLTVKAVLGPDANVGNVVTQLRTTSWAYFDAHGYASLPTSAMPEPSDSVPLTGALSLGALQNVMSRDNLLKRNGLILQDGVLTAESLVKSDLPGLDLVVLGACQSGLGVIARGEGVIGLQRAFHQAGVRNVVASLWQVTLGEARLLLTDFHRALADDSISKPEALRQAQLKIIHKEEGNLSMPFFWAAWVVSGDPRPVRQAAASSR